MSRVITTPYQAQRIALEQLVLREAELIRAERDKEFRYKKEAGDEWYANEIRNLQEWFAYLERTHREQNLRGLPPGELLPEPATKPFKFTFVMLGDAAAGESMCDDISDFAKIFAEIMAIIALQSAIGVMLGSYEVQRRDDMKLLSPGPFIPGLPAVAATTTTTTTGGDSSSSSSTATVTVKPPTPPV